MNDPTPPSIDSRHEFSARGEITQASPRPRLDPYIILATMALLMVGWVMVFSASAISSDLKVGGIYSQFLKQVLAGCIGLIVMFLLAYSDYRYLKAKRLMMGLVFRSEEHTSELQSH